MHKIFALQNGHCAVKKKHNADPALGYWVNDMRIAKRERRLPAAQQAALEAMGFEWEARRQCGSAFMVGFREMCEYRDANDSIDVEAAAAREGAMEQEVRLAAWARAQRAARAKGLLSDKRVAFLEGIGFEW